MPFFWINHRTEIPIEAKCAYLLELVVQILLFWMLLWSQKTFRQQVTTEVFDTLEEHKAEVGMTSKLQNKEDRVAHNTPQV